MSTDIFNSNTNQQTDISVTIGIYDQATGVKKINATSLNLNKANPGKFTTPVAIRMFANGARQIKNIKLGVVDSSGMEADGSGTTNSDGSVSSGNIGIQHSQSITQKTELTSFFKNINTTERSSNEGNVAVDNLGKNSSEYVYLNIKIPETGTEGYIQYKWFFDFVE